MAHSRSNKGVTQQFFRFAVVGVIAYLVNALVVEFAKQSIGPAWGQVFAFPCASTIAWLLNRKFTFAVSIYGLREEWFRYLFANLLGWAINNGLYFTLIFFMRYMYQHPAIAIAIGSLAGMIFNFTMSRNFAFGKKNNL